MCYRSLWDAIVIVNEFLDKEDKNVLGININKFFINYVRDMVVFYEFNMYYMKIKFG